jgi:hypothetical protein
MCQVQVWVKVINFLLRIYCNIDTKTLNIYNFSKINIMITNSQIMHIVMDFIKTLPGNSSVKVQHTQAVNNIRVVEVFSRWSRGTPTGMT